MPLRPRSLAMWRYLAAHPGRLVTKVEVHRARWGGRTIALARPMASSTGTSANREARLRMAVSFHIAKMNSIN